MVNFLSIFLNRGPFKIARKIDFFLDLMMENIRKIYFPSFSEFFPKTNNFKRFKMIHSQLSDSFPDDLTQSTQNISDIYDDDPDIQETKRLTQIQFNETQRYNQELKQARKSAQKLAQTHIEAHTLIKEAELEEKKYELEKMKAEREAELATRQEEADEEIRAIHDSCGQLQNEVADLERELSEVKEERKHNLLFVRSQIEKSLKDLEKRQMEHAQQVNQLKVTLNSLIQKHQKEYEDIQTEADAQLQIYDTEIANLTDSIERARNELIGRDEMQNQRMNELLSAIDNLKSENISAVEQSNNTDDEITQIRIKYAQLQQELYKCEEESHILSEQLSYAEEQKKIMKKEVSKLEKSLWNIRKTKFLQDV